MDLSFLDTLQPHDLQWFVPVAAGLVVVLGAVIVALFRGMTAGVLAAIVLGGLMSLSPTLLARLEQRTAASTSLPGEVARGAAQLALLNSDVVTELSAVMGTLRNAVSGLAPVIGAGPGATPDPDAMALFTQSLSDTDSQLERTTTSIEQINRLRATLEADVLRLNTELAGSSATAAPAAN